MLIEASSLFSCSHSPLRSTKTTTDTAAVLFQIIEPSQCARVTVTIAHFIISDYCTTMAEVSVSRKASNQTKVCVCEAFTVTEKAPTGVILVDSAYQHFHY